MAKYIDKLSNAQIRLVRWLAETGAAPSFSQACRAITEKDPIVAEWKKVAADRGRQRQNGGKV